MEPHIAIARWDSDDRLEITSSTQVPFHVRRMVAPLLGLPVKQIRIIKPRIGGGFGAKQEMLIEDIVGHLTMATGRPVRLELTREEEFMSSRTRHPQTITFRTGVDAEGSSRRRRCACREHRRLRDARADRADGVGMRGLSSYNSPLKRFDCKVAYTNIPVPGAYRGYGAPQALFALEAHMEDIAAAIGMDAIEFRRRNWTKVGDPIDIAPSSARGTRGGRGTCRYHVERPRGGGAPGKRAIGWQRRDDPAWGSPPTGPTSAAGSDLPWHARHGHPGPRHGGGDLKINDDGSFNLLVGATDLGTGSDTVLAQIAAEVVGVGTGDILVYSSDTDITPFDTGAYASSTTYISGTAVKRAAEQVRSQIIDRAALLLGVDIGAVDLHDRAAWSTDGSP